jgi:hypothetical protein
MLRSSSGKKCRAATAWGGRSAKTRALILAQATTGAPAIPVHKRIQQDSACAARRQEPVLRTGGTVRNSSTRGGGRRTGWSTDCTVRCANGCYSTTTAGGDPTVVAPTAEIQQRTWVCFVQTTIMVPSARAGG